MSKESVIVLYTKNQCPACKMTKRWLKERGIDFVEENVEEKQELITELREKGYVSLPYIKVGEEAEWTGFQPNKLKELIC